MNDHKNLKREKTFQFFDETCMSLATFSIIDPLYLCGLAKKNVLAYWM